ncbi:MAG: VWA domain-containing protein, partial [Planctomycetota bacterium]|nr:VWA domain-containing protein [Planctomycetota bacterium]
MMTSSCARASLLLLCMSTHALTAGPEPRDHFEGSRTFLPPQGKRGSEPDRVLKSITRWLWLYRKGDLMPGTRLGMTKSLLKKADLEHLRYQGNGRSGTRRQSPPGNSGSAGTTPTRRPSLTARSELSILLRAAGKIQTAKAYKLLLEVAAVGLDRRYRYSTEMAPAGVRQLGETSLVRIAGRDDVHSYLVAAAKGDPSGPASLDQAMRIAALRVLARGEREFDHRMVEEVLKDSDSIMRLTAAECLGRVGRGYSVEWLAAAIEKEGAPNSLIALVWAIRDVHRKHATMVKADHLRRAVIAAGAHLGSVVERPTCNALVDFLETFRYPGSVPVLIALLERLNTDSTLSRPNKLSAAMPQRVNHVLKTMTGAIVPKDDPAQWREFWAKEGSKIDVTKIARKKTSGASQGGTVSEFFGIPIQGRRIVFIIDVSGSMGWPMPQEAAGTSASRDRGQILKIDKAKQELLKAVNGLEPHHKFNVVVYSNNVQKWQKGVVPANKKYKKSLAQRMRGQRANGGTNLFGGLKSGLQMKSLVYGARYDSNVDEIFLLSDGVPTVGDVTNMNEILKLIGETNRYSGVRINAIYLGSKSDERRQGNGGRSERDGGDFMKKLADQNGGQFAWPIVGEVRVPERGGGRGRPAHKRRR